jgi:hypothetical protein
MPHEVGHETSARYANLPKSGQSIEALQKLYDAAPDPITRTAIAQLIAGVKQNKGMTGAQYEDYLNLKQEILNQESFTRSELDNSMVRGTAGDTWRRGITQLESLYPPDKGWVIMSEVPNTQAGEVVYQFKNLLDNMPVATWTGTFMDGALVAVTPPEKTETDSPASADDWYLSKDRLDDSITQMVARVPTTFDLGDGQSIDVAVGDTFHSSDGGATWMRGVAPFATVDSAIPAPESNYDALQLMLDFQVEKRLALQDQASVRSDAAKLGFSYEELAQNTALEQSRQAEDARQFNMGFGEQQRQFNVNTQEAALQRIAQGRAAEEANATQRYFSSLEELGRNYRTMIETSPAMANAATNQGELIRNILKEGGDVLARTYFTRGGMSPLPEITQADLINNLNDEMVQLQEFEINAVNQENRRIQRADRDRARAEYQTFVNAEMAKPQEMVGKSRFDQQGWDKMVGGWDEFVGSDRYAASIAAGEEAQAALDAFNFEEVAAAAVPRDATGAIDEMAGGLQAGLDAAQAQKNELQSAVAQAASETTMPSEGMFTENWTELAPRNISTFDQWYDAGGASFGPSSLLTPPKLNIPRRVFQDQLIADARATTPPAVTSVMSGQMPTPLSFGNMPLPTFQQLQALTPTEQQMFNQRLMTEYNVPLADVAFQSQRQFGEPSAGRSRDLAKFRGYSV